MWLPPAVMASAVRPVPSLMGLRLSPISIRLVADPDAAAVAELTLGAASPALDGVVVEDGAGVAAGGDGECGAACAEVDGGEVVAHLARLVPDVRAASVAEIAPVPEAPALGGVVVEEGAGVEVAGGDGECGAACAEVDGGEVVAHLAWLVADPDVAAVAELTVDALSPALDGVVVEEGAGVASAGGDGECGAACAEVDRGEVVAHFRRSVADVSTAVAVAELTRVTVPPALDGCVVEDGAGVAESRRERRGLALDHRLLRRIHGTRLAPRAQRDRQGEHHCCRHHASRGV